MTINGIDISHWNRVTDFNKVKESGIDFAIIKAGGSDAGFYTDKCFDNYYRLAKLAGLHVGAYYFAGRNFTSGEAGKADAARFIRILQNKQFDYPVYIDVEATYPKDIDGATDATIAFCDHMEDNGFFVGIYSSDISGFKERLHLDRLGPYSLWVARYGKKPQNVKKFGIWQRSSKGAIPGIIGNVDLDTSYIDYQGIIIPKHFNGY